MRNISDKFLYKIETPILCSKTLFFENSAVYEICGKILYSRTGHERQYGACVLQTR